MFTMRLSINNLSGLWAKSNEKETIMQFYNVKKREKVEISDDQLKKTVYTGKSGQKRYAVRAVDDDGTNLTRFVSKDDYDALDAPEE